MANPWFRVYTEMVDDEKMRLLAFEDRWHFVALLCCKGSGMLDSQGSKELLMRKLGVKLGLASRELDACLSRLAEVGLIEEETAQPIAWDDRQFMSDGSTERVRAYRERMKRKGNVSETAQDTDTDTDTEQKKIKNKSVQPAAAPARFDEFWQVYPNKKGKQEAEKRWRRDKLDAMAEQIIAHVRLMMAEDDGWKRNYVPMGSTYLNQARWTDVPQSAPNRTNGIHHAPAKLTPAERIAVNIARDNGGQIPAGYEGNRNVVAALGGDIRPQVDERVRGHGNGFGGPDLGEGIKWLNGNPSR